MNFDQLLPILTQKLPPRRLRHSLGVAETAVGLAKQYGGRVETARMAGLLHDYARDLPSDTLLEVAEQAGLITCSVERLMPDLLHGPVAAWLIPRELGIKDSEVLRAIALHTLGAEEMALLDKIIYIADAIEPGRKYPGVEYLRQLVKVDLDQALLAGYNQTIKYCLDRNYLLHPRTILARNTLVQILYSRVSSD